MDWENIQTEAVNSDTSHIDTLPTIEMVTLMNQEDHKVADAVEKELDRIAAAVDVIVEKMKEGGRLIYIGCGTSGRLGVLDAVECVPTFSTEPGQVQGILAGGESAMFASVEGAEDSREQGAEDLKKIDFSSDDVLVGIAASGRTPYVLGALSYAGEIGAPTIAVCCSKNAPVSELADIAITPVPGPEVITGSTRLKSGTAEKMVLNMLSTCSMIKLGKVYGNLMVDVKPSNQKLIHRCERIVSASTGVSEEEAAGYLKQCEYRPKVAIVMIKCGADADEARKMLDAHNGRVAEALEDAGK